MPHCLILDIGKTNKKYFVFDEHYRLVFAQSATLPETTDEDGDPCEDLALLTAWVRNSVQQVMADERFQVRALNAAAYGASLVHLDAGGQPLTLLYNYLKPYPDDLLTQFWQAYGGAEKLALETASPMLGSLNSGLQLYRLKHRRPPVFEQIKWSLHLPQYVALVATQAAQPSESCQFSEGYLTSERTSLGCHTLLWDFQKNDYHSWVWSEGITQKFPPLQAADGLLQITQSPTHQILGPGLHDSSAALIPYLSTFPEPFLLLSTGTWCISLNPFNPEPLTAEELAQDCLCYLTPAGTPVKAARYFGGHEHEQAVLRIAADFGVPADFYQSLHGATRPNVSFMDLQQALDAYVAFMRQLVEKQVASTRLALGGSAVRRIFVDGGFSKNTLYMNLLAQAFPEQKVFAAEVAQATALGAALAIHAHWNERPLPEKLISLKRY